MATPTREPATQSSRALRAYVPGLGVLASYPRSWLPRDVVAGLVLSALLVPQGMAYAELAGLPPITGLYTSILCLLGYAVFGPSRVLVLGPDSSLGPMIAATIAPLMLANGDPARAIALASFLALTVGVVMVLAGLANFGFVADLLSKPTQIGYMNGLALTIVVGQLPKLLGFSVDADGLIAEFSAFLSGLATAGNRTAARWVSRWQGFCCCSGCPRIRCVVPWCWPRRGHVLAWRSTVVDTIVSCPRFPPFTIPTVAWPTCHCCWLGPAIALVPCRPHVDGLPFAAARRAVAQPGDGCIGAANLAPACSRDSRSARAGPARPSRSRPVPGPRSLASSVPE